MVFRVSYCFVRGVCCGLVFYFVLVSLFGLFVLIFILLKIRFNLLVLLMRTFSLVLVKFFCALLWLR